MSEHDEQVDKRHLRLIDLSGKKFGRWTVMCRVLNSQSKGYKWVCLCHCGIVKAVDGCSLRRGQSTSCGCSRAKQKVARASNRNHGLSHLKEYRVWCGMKARCYNKSNPRYKDWGGKGIGVCDRWRNSFVNFYADMGDRPSDKHSIDRIDGMSGYSPENCRWATPKEQSENRPFFNHIIEFDGRSQCMAAWAHEFGLHRGLLKDRLRNGWAIEEALMTPPLPTRRSGLVLFGGNMRSRAELAREYGVSLSTLKQRLKNGWGIDRALIVPTKNTMAV